MRNFFYLVRWLCWRLQGNNGIIFVYNKLQRLTDYDLPINYGNVCHNILILFFLEFLLFCVWWCLDPGLFRPNNRDVYVQIRCEKHGFVFKLDFFYLSDTMPPLLSNTRSNIRNTAIPFIHNGSKSWQRFNDPK